MLKDIVLIDTCIFSKRIDFIPISLIVLEGNL